MPGAETGWSMLDMRAQRAGSGCVYPSGVARIGEKKDAKLLDRATPLLPDHRSGFLVSAFNSSPRRRS